VKWEYCIVTQYYPRKVPTIRYLTPEGVIPDIDYFESIDVAVARMGAEGWELVSVVRDGSMSPGVTYYFKRPVDTSFGRFVAMPAVKVNET
jgi:hypothetical protein